MKIEAVIIDDEENCREVLKDLIQEYFKNVSIVGEASNVEGAFNLIQEKKPHLVFLDIQMPKQSGFNLLKKYEEIPFEVVFVTSHDQFAINAIKFSALDYLLKPVELRDLEETIKKANKHVELKNRNQAQVINLLNTLSGDQVDLKIAIHHGDLVKLLGISDIVCIESDGRYCHITSASKERLTTAKLIKEFDDFLGSTSPIIRIHKSCMINVTHIKTYSKGEPCIITMNNGSTFEVARRKKQEIMERLKG